MIAGIQMAKRKAFSWKLSTALAVGYCVLANVAFIGYFYKGGFAELDRDAAEINLLVESHGEVITYQLARVSNEKGLSLNDTSNPSLGFYLRQERIKFSDTASLGELEARLKHAYANQIFVLTRPGRLDGSDLEKLKADGWTASPVYKETNESHYQLLSVFRDNGQG
jgi:hypothetical protein